MPAKTKKASNSSFTTSKLSTDATTTAPPTNPRSAPLPTLPSRQQNGTTISGQGNTGPNGEAEPANQGPGDTATQPAVNRKKQKRREKEAAKRAVEQQAESEDVARNGYDTTARGSARSYFREEPDDYTQDYLDDLADGDEAFFSGDEGRPYEQADLLGNGFGQLAQSADGLAGKKKKKGKQAGQQVPTQSQQQRVEAGPPVLRNPTPPPRSHLPPTPSLSAAALRSAHRNFSHDQIWNTSTQAERENIKQFWLELGEDERRSLVKVEKEAVLLKMKEQQKHSCSCTVCGRKRTAIEEELEVLYDAYYEELEQFANHNNDLSDETPIMSEAQAYDHLPNRRHPMAGQFPLEVTGRYPPENDQGDNENEEPSSEEDVEEVPRGPPDFFTFGNSLTVKDGILTVAEDLLKNDGKHFIDMMESLAEKRMQREEAIHFPSAALAHQNSHQGHNHPPLDEEDDFDDEEDEEDEEYESQEDDDLEADEMDAMTEEQRMEEGRRMFQIFAARMFEQRVLTAYRERVAQERQEKLIEELEEEDRLGTQREAKKAREAAKKKEKKKMQKQVKDEEKAKKEAEKAAQKAAVRAAENLKLEEQRQRKEEQRKKREAEKKAADEERLKKEADKQRRAQEDRERQQELERRQRESKEREKRKREDARKRDREDKEAREREARENKAKEAQERRALEQQVRKEKEAAAKVERETRGRARQEEQARQNAKRPPVAVPTGIHPAHPSAMQSPSFQVATPIVPTKAPTPARARRPSQQGPQSHGSSPRSQQAATTETTLSSTPSSASIALPNPPLLINAPGKHQGPDPPLHHPQPSAPLSPLNSQSRSGQSPYGYNATPGPLANGTAHSGLGMMAGMMPPLQMYQGPPIGGPHRGYGLPNGLPFPPGITNRQFPPGSAGHFKSQTQLAPAAPIAPKPPLAKPHSHSRQQSGSYERSDLTSQPNPISRPAPAGRSSNSTPDKQESRKAADPEVDHLATQLGSKALLDDSDVPLSASTSEPISAPGAPGSGRAPFSNFPDPRHDAFQAGNWGAFSPNGAFAGPPNWGAPGLVPKKSAGWPTPQTPGSNAFGIIGGGVHATNRPHASRPVAIRLMIAEACKSLSATPGTSSDGFHPVQFLLRHIEQMKPPHEPTISLKEMLEICDTEGNAQNGGGSFVIRNDGFQGQSVRFEAAGGSSIKRAVGDIGSPIAGHSNLATFGGIGQPVNGPNKAY